MEKFMVGNFDWSEKPNNTNFLQAKFLLAHSDGSTIPGLSVDLRVRLGRVGEDCLFNFSIFKLKNGRPLRLYQAIVQPENKVSHQTREGPWFGPYQHFGERAEKFGNDAPKGCAEYEAWFREFLKRGNIQFGGSCTLPPAQGELIE